MIGVCRPSVCLMSRMILKIIWYFYIFVCWCSIILYAIVLRFTFLTCLSFIWYFYIFVCWCSIFNFVIVFYFIPVPVVCSVVSCGVSWGVLWCVLRCPAVSCGVSCGVLWCVLWCPAVSCGFQTYPRHNNSPVKNLDFGLLIHRDSPVKNIRKYKLKVYSNELFYFN